MFKDLLVATTGQGDDAAAVGAGIALALENSAHLTVLVQLQVQLPVAMPGNGAAGSFPVADYLGAIEAARRKGEADRDRWNEAMRVAGITGEVRLEQDFPGSVGEVSALHARYSDLSLLGLGAFPTLPSAVHEHFGRLLLASGRPVLVVPAEWKPAPVRRAVIGWHPGAPAARAVHEARGWLAQARQVDVVCADSSPGRGGPGEEPGADLATHLARHGIHVTVHRVPGVGRDPGEVLLQWAGEYGADLLVAGGYGHSRLREWALGGTTRFLLQHASLPVLFSH